MRSKTTIEFLGIWERINNPLFKQVEFDLFKNEAVSNSLTLSHERWIKGTDAIGTQTSKARYNSGTFAHKDIAF